MRKISQTCLHGLLLGLFLLGINSLTPALALGGSSLSLFDAEKDEVIEAFLESRQYNLADLPAQLTLVDEPFLSGVESVVFFVNGMELRTENIAPFSLGGDIDGDLFAFDFQAGEYNIEVKYYSQDNGMGAFLGFNGVSLCFYNLPELPLFQTDLPLLTISGTTAQFLEASLEAGEKAEVNFFLEADAQLLIDQLSFSHPWLSLKAPLQAGNNTLIIDASNLPASDFVYDESINLSASLPDVPCRKFFHSFRVSLRVLPSEAISVTQLTIVDADEDKDACAAFGTGPRDIPTVTTFAFDAGCLPENFNFRASTYGEVKSVIFQYAYTAPGEEEKPIAFLRNENVEPFAAFGDFPAGDYYGIPVKAGLYRIKVTPFSEIRGRGKRGIPLEIVLRIDEPSNLPRQDDPALSQQLDFKDRLAVYPNPIYQESHITFQVTQEGPVEITLYDLRGNQIRTFYKGNLKREDRLKIDFKREEMESGIYILRVVENQQAFIKRIILE